MKCKKRVFQYLILSFLFLIHHTVLKSQDFNSIDVTFKKISQLPDSPVKVDSLIFFSRKFTNIDPLKALKFTDLANSLSFKLNYTKGKMDTYYEYCFIYKMEGNLDSALFNIKKFIVLSDSLNEKRNLAKGYFQYANLIRRKGLTDSALVYFHKSEKKFSELRDSTSLGGIYNSLGIYFETISDFDSAAFYFLKAIKLFDNKKNENGTGPILVNLGKVYFALEKYDRAINYLNQSIDINSKNNNLSNVALAYTVLGNVANKKNQLTSALDYYEKAEVIYRQINNFIGINNLYTNYGDVYLKQGKYSLALTNFDLALEYFQQTGYTRGVLAVLSNKAAICTKQKKYTQATSLYDTCLKLTWQINDREGRKDIYSSLTALHSEQGEYKKALEYLEKQMLLQDSIDKNDAETQIADLTLRYEKEKDQARILILENENLAKDLSIRKRTNQRNAYLFSGLAIILLVLFVSGYLRNLALREKIVSEQRIKQLEDEKKMLAVRFLVEGQEEERKRIAKEMHDGIGVLLATAKMQFSSISNVNPESKLHIEKATKLLEQATSDVRKITHNMMPGLLTKFGFFEAVEDLIEQLDDAGTISAKVVVEGEPFRFQENKEIMLYRIIQEMVHNTIKHAKATIINLVLEILPEKLNLTFVDNGQGFDVPQMLQKQSIGLTSIQSRVSFLDGKLNIDSSPGMGTIFRLEVSLS